MLQYVGLPVDMNNSHMLSTMEHKMCVDDRKIWGEIWKRKKTPATLEALMNWLEFEMIRVELSGKSSSGKRHVKHFRSDSDKPH